MNLFIALTDVFLSRNMWLLILTENTFDKRVLTEITIFW